MKARSFIFFLLSLLPACIIAQAAPKKVLLYCNKIDFLVPKIESTVESLQNVVTKEKMFIVSNLNSYLANNQVDRLIRQDIFYVNPEAVFDPLPKLLKDSITKAFTDNDYFLLVNENTLQDKVEFQMTLFKIIKDPNQNTFPIKNIKTPFAQSDFFVNISSASYSDDLENGIRKMFPNSIEKLRFSIDVGGNVSHISKNRFIVSINDSIIIQPKDIFSGNSVLNKLKFKPILISSDSLFTEGEYNIRNLDDWNSEMILYKPGNYRLILQCDNGIGVFRSDTAEVKGVAIPKIFTLQTKIEIVDIYRFLGKARDYSIPVFLDLPQDSIAFNYVSSNSPNLSIEQAAIVKAHHFDKTTIFPLANGGRSSMYLVKRDSQLYQIHVKRDVMDWDDKLTLYGVSQNLSTNTIDIFFHRYIYSPVTVGIGFAKYWVNVDTSCKQCGLHPRKNLVSMNLPLFRLNLDLSKRFGVELGIAPVESKLEDSSFYAKISSNVDFRGYFVYNESIGRFIFQYKPYLGVHSFNLSFRDQGSVTPTKKSYTCLEGGLEALLIPKKIQFGLFANLNFLYSLQNHSLGMSGGNFEFGIAYRPFIEKSRNRQ